jgi:citrate lyase gamma subunit
MTQKSLESDNLIKAGEQEKQSSKLNLNSSSYVDTGDEVKDTMQDMIAAIELANQKRKRAANVKGGY